MDKELIRAEVQNASKKWVETFNKGNIRQCSEAYSENAVMDARPMGRYDGRSAIFEFWKEFVNSTNAKDLVYTDIEIGVVDEISAILSAKWSMNVGKGLITKELWIKTEGTWLLSEDDFTVEEQF